MNCEEDASASAAEGRLSPRLQRCRSRSGAGLGAHCLDSCVVEVGWGVVCVPVCTAALLAGLSLLRMRTHCHWNSNRSLFQPLAPLSGATHFWNNIKCCPSWSHHCALVANHFLLFSSLLNQDKMFPVFLRILLMK